MAAHPILHGHVADLVKALHDGHHETQKTASEQHHKHAPDVGEAQGTRTPSPSILFLGIV